LILLFSALAAEAELKKYGQFVDDYAEKLKQSLVSIFLIRASTFALPVWPVEIKKIEQN
jgi:hypothetical protein